MSEQTSTPNRRPNLPFPAQVPLIVAFVGLLLVIGVAFTQTTFTVVGWAGLALLVIGVVAWVLLAPEQAKAALTGRTARYGGASFVVTVVFLAALVAVYVFVRDREWRVDLTERNEFSLNDESRRAISGIGVDPNTPPIRLLAFYGANQAGRRDQDTLLFDDYATTSNGRISYEFVDPDRNPLLANRYGVSRQGQIVVVAMRPPEEIETQAQGDQQTEPTGNLTPDENGLLPDVQNAELVSSFSQENLTNAILKVAASGDFRAYFITAGSEISMSDISRLTAVLRDSYDWTTQEISIFQLTAPGAADTEAADSESEAATNTEDEDGGVGSAITEAPSFRLNDPAADGEVLVFLDGTDPLTDAQMEAIRSYLDNGGDLVIFAGMGRNDEGQSLATSENLSSYLFENFGLRFRNDIVLDLTQAVQTPAVPVAADFDSTHYITAMFASGQEGLIFEVPHSIEVSAEPPENVTVTELARTTNKAYSKTDFNAVVQGDLAQGPDDPTGPFVLAAAAENTVTGARVVLFGSTSVVSNNYAISGLGIVNLDAAFNSLVWATNFNDFFSQIQIMPTQRLQDTPIFATTEKISTINFITILVIPFGVLGIGLLVWWNNRERAH